MKGTRSLWLSLTLILLSGLAYADGLPPGDPQIEINDPICQPNPAITNSCGQVVFAKTPFFFTANGDGPTTPGTFQVAPDNNFFSIDVETVGTFDVLSCSSSRDDSSFHPFQCTTSVLAGGVTNFHFFIPDTCDGGCGFPANDQFFISTFGFAPGTAFEAIANLGDAPTTPFISTPEPSALLLFGVGAACTRIRKRVRSS